MLPLTNGFNKAYTNTFDPRVTNEFAAAAFRVGHTWIPDVIRAIDAISRYMIIDDSAVTKSIIYKCFNSK